MAPSLSPYARFVAASGLTNLSDGVATVAWAWLASLLTRDPLLIALVPVALRLPWFLAALPAGVIADRVDRRALILWMDAVRAASFAVAGVAIWGALPLPPASEAGVSQSVLFAVIVTCALAVGTAEVFRDNAAQTMMPTLVPHAELERANGRLWSVETVGNQLAGPALGAFLIAAFVPGPFLINALAYGAAIVLVLRIKGDFRPKVHLARNWRRELGEGYSYLRNAPLLRMLAVVTGLWNLFASMALVALVLHVQENLGADAPTYGLILAAGALGGIAGGWVAATVVRWLGQRRAAQWTLATSAPCFALLGLAPGALSLAATLVVFYFAGLIWNTVSVSYRQRTIPDALLGRVNSLYRLLAWGMMPVGLLASGLIVRSLDGPLPRGTALEAPFFVAATGALALGVWGWGALRRGFPAKGALTVDTPPESP